MKQFKQLSLLCLLWLVEMSASAEVYTGDCVSKLFEMYKKLTK